MQYKSFINYATVDLKQTATYEMDLHTVQNHSINAKTGTPEQPLFLNKRA